MIFKLSKIWDWPISDCDAEDANCQTESETKCAKNDCEVKLDDKTKETENISKDVVCNYLITWTKIYIILIIWGKYVFDVYISYVRQFSLLNRTTRVPIELRQFFSDSDFEEVKVQCMFKTLLHLESKYNEALRLTVIYVTNMYCTMWWLASKISSGFLSRIVIFQAMQTLFQYNLGDLLHHVLLISSSCSTGEGACRFCLWVKDIILKCWSCMATLNFVEEILLAVILTLMTTPACVILFLLYRIYRNFFLPHMIEENTSSYVELQEGNLFEIVHDLCRKIDFPVETLYISFAINKHLYSAKIRGLDDRKYMVLGWKLVDGHVDDVQKVRALYSDFGRNERNMFTISEISSAIVRAKNEYTIAVPSQDILLEATRWVPTVLFAIFLTFGFFGGSRLGFTPAPPQTIAFTISKHVAIPIFTIVQAVKNYECRKRSRILDDIVCDEGFGEELIAYIGKEARLTSRCPVEDPFYTWAYSSSYSPLCRVKYLKNKLHLIDTQEKPVEVDKATNTDNITNNVIEIDNS